MSVESQAMAMLQFMGLVRQAALQGDPLAQPYLDVDAVRVVDGEVQFHKDRFLKVLGEQVELERINDEATNV